jgi:DNA-binding transcriptional LysR family regulator
LFDSDQYRPNLTDEGKIFFQWARESLASFRTLDAIGKEMGDKKAEPMVRIVLDPLVQYEEVHPIFDHCLGPLIPTELSLRTEILGKSAELLLAEEADIAIGVNFKSHDRIEAIPFKSVDMIPVAHRRIAENYKKYPQIIVVSPDSHGSISSGPHCFVSDHALKHQLIKSGYGWGRLARHEIENDLKKKTLVKVQDPVVKPFKVDLMLMRNKNAGLGPIARKIWQGLSR